MTVEIDALLYIMVSPVEDVMSVIVPEVYGLHRKKQTFFKEESKKEQKCLVVSTKISTFAPKELQLWVQRRN